MSSLKTSSYMQCYVFHHGYLRKFITVMCMASQNKQLCNVVYDLNGRVHFQFDIEQLY